MNLMELLQWLHPDLAEWERQRRLKAMSVPGEQYMDGPQLNPGGMFYDAIPRNNYGHGGVTKPGLGHFIMPYELERPQSLTAPIAKREKRT